MFHVFSYLTTNTDVESALESVYNNLSGGLFVFDYWFTLGVLSLKPECRYKQIEIDDYIIHRAVTFEHEHYSNIVNIKYDYIVVNKIDNVSSTFNETHKMRYFSIPEIEYFANKIGFHHLESRELITSSPASLDTWAVYSVLQKK